jgi:hypothetical protein
MHSVRTIIKHDSYTNTAVRTILAGRTPALSR